MSIVVRPGAPFLAHFGQAGPPFLTIQTTGPRTRPATRISDGRFSEAPLRDATQADQEHEGLAQFYNCSYEHTLIIRRTYDCSARLYSLSLLFRLRHKVPIDSQGRTYRSRRPTTKAIVRS